MYGGKKGGLENKEKKNLKGKKLNWFYLYIHFVWCNRTIVKIYLEDVYDIFYKWFVYISIAHTIHISLFFLLYCSNFIKMYVRRCAQIVTYFFY